MTHALIIGHSHITAPRRAAAALGVTRLRFVELARPSLQLLEADGALAMDLRALLANELPAAGAVISMVGGNAHNLFGLVNHPQPFDFVLDERPDLPLAEGHHLIPSALVERILQRAAQADLDVLAGVRREVRAPMFHVESPPPIPSDAHIRRRPGIFAGELASSSVAPRTLRYKLWRLHSRLFRRLCEANDIGFIPAPAETFDADSFLGERFWNPDPTHGNEHYGARVLAQIAAVPMSNAA